ncbi:MAG: KOW motif-containing protein [Spirochaetales bacterium]|nr:KOW motif-containing protein [Spirochaetales bacterium]
MSFFVIQVGTGTEGKFVRAARPRLPAETRLWWLRRNLRIRKRGRWQDSDASIFPGYLFLEAGGVSPELFRLLRQTPGFHRFLKDNQNIEPLGARDLEIVRHFLSCGEVLQRSTVVFDEQNRIRVISGPLKGLEGRIVRVDRRKRRARVKIELYEDSFLIDFGYEALERAPEAR